MKIVHIVDYLGGSGGVNSFVYDLSEQQYKMGHEVTIIGILSEAWNKEGCIELPEGVNAFVLGATTRSDSLKRISKLRKIIIDLAGNQEMVCNLHLKMSVLIGTLATIGLKNVHCVETYHSQYRNYWLENKLLSLFIERYICCSDSAYEEMKKRFNPPSNKTFAVQNGIPINKIKHGASLGKTKKKHGIQILSVGRLSAQKNFHITAAAFSRLKNGEDICYRIVGSGVEQKKIIEAANGSSILEMVGTLSRNDVLSEVKQADIVVMPSLWEGLSIFMLEAMALSAPLMLSNVDSLRNVFGEPALKANEAWRLCKWGYLVDTSNCDAYTDAMEHYIGHQELQNEMRKAVYKVAQKYDMSETAKKYVEIYESIF